MGKLISFSGFDGVGKSTQVNLLLKYLMRKKYKVSASESTFSYFLLKPLIGFFRAVTDSPSEGPVRRNKSLPLKLWFLPAFVDIWMGYLFKIVPMLHKYDFVIADRFYTDIWANLLYYGYCPKWAFRFLTKLLPRADIALLLQADPKNVLKREKEFSPDYYYAQQEIYEQLSQLLKFNVIDANKISRVVHDDICLTIGAI